jgi:hypothetical protein
METEEWVDVIGYDGYYEVSNKGRVKSLTRKVSARYGEITVKGRILKGSIRKSKNGNHYHMMNLSMENVARKYFVSQLVYCSFNNIYLDDYRHKGVEVCHLDKICLNNNLSNLSLETLTVSHSLVHQLKGLSKFQKKQYQNRTDDYNALTHRKCKTCDVTKPIEEYYRVRKVCKVCVRKKMNEYDKLNKRIK